MTNINLNSTNTATAQAGNPTGRDDSYSVRIGKTNFIVRVLPSENAKKPLESALREACTQDILCETSRSDMFNLEKTQQTS